MDRGPGPRPLSTPPSRMSTLLTGDIAPPLTVVDMGVNCQVGIEFPTPSLKTQFITECYPGDWEDISDTEVEAYWENTRSLPQVEEFISTQSCDSDGEFIFQVTIEDITTTRFIQGGVVIDETEEGPDS